MYLLCILLSIIFFSTPTCNSKKKKINLNYEEENENFLNCGKKQSKFGNKDCKVNEDSKENNNVVKVQNDKNKCENGLVKNNLNKSNQCTLPNQNNNDIKTNVNKKDKKNEKLSKKNPLLASIKSMKDKFTIKDGTKNESTIFKSEKKVKKISGGNDKTKNENIDKTQITEATSDFEDSQKLFDDRVKLVKDEIDKEENKQNALKNNNNKFFIEENIEVWACNSLSNSSSVIKF
ncbi:Hypothetical protein SRAE_2000170000 [Strongyloides ratti]|uniref:Uncharacterized protein n=1 Tax=Strongyloides ratti TaxID=34506 RepID=A0A090LHP4_STRRB|nr:Hypothetical protein SRAE_2000170000 [Strongyloides ratti]CEF67035.1 Hypothetical protein SRAE_2000170000 [Strongyloides ratti]